MKIDYDRLGRLAKEFLFLNARYPTYTPRFIERNLTERLAIEPADLQTFQANCSTRGHRARNVLIAAYTLYALKTFYAAWECYELMDPNQLESGLGQANESSAAIKNFACLATNCSRLSTDGKLASDLTRLPLFGLCFPRLNSIYNPISSLDSLSILVYSFMAFGTLLLGAFIPLLQNFFRTGNELFMFDVAPGATTELMRERARGLLWDLSVSMDNFLLGVVAFNRRRRAILLSLTGDAERDLSYRSGYQRPANKSSEPVGIRYRASRSTNRVSYAGQQSANGAERGLDLAANDCLPAVRSDWWRQQIVCVFFRTTIFSMAGFFSGCVLIFTYLNVRVARKRGLLAVFAQTMAADNCSIWIMRPGTSGDPYAPAGDPIHLDLVDLSWGWYAILETIWVNLLPGSSTAILFACYDRFIGEAACWLSELKLHLIGSMAKLDYERLVRQRFPSLAEQLDQLTWSAQLTSHKSLKRRFMEETRTLSNLFVSRIDTSPLGPPGERCRPHIDLINASSVDKIRARILAAELLWGAHRGSQSEPDCGDRSGSRSNKEFSLRGHLEARYEALEAVYVNFRLYVDYIHSYSPDLTLIMINTYIFNYGLVFIAVFLHRHFEDFKTEPLFVVASGWTVANFLILLASNLTAKVGSHSKRRDHLLRFHLLTLTSTTTNQTDETTPATCLVARCQNDPRQGAPSSTFASPLVQTGPEARRREWRCPESPGDTDHLRQHHPGECRLACSARS